MKLAIDFQIYIIILKNFTKFHKFIKIQAYFEALLGLTTVLLEVGRVSGTTLDFLLVDIS